MQWHAEDGTEYNMVELSGFAPLWSHLESTRCHGNQQSCQYLYNHITRSLQQKLITIRSARTRATRFLHIECKRCGAYAYCKYDAWTTEADVEDGRRRLVRFFAPSPEQEQTLARMAGERPTVCQARFCGPASLRSRRECK